MIKPDNKITGPGVAVITVLQNAMIACVPSKSYLDVLEKTLVDRGGWGGGEEGRGRGRGRGGEGER